MLEPSPAPSSVRKLPARHLITAGGLGAVALIGTVFANTDALVARGFADAIAGAKPVARQEAVASAPTVSGTEEFWLSRAVSSAVKPAAWQAPRAHASAIGQRFTLTANGAARTLEIVDVRALASGSDAAADTPSPMLLVTAKDTADTAAAPVRLVLEPGQTLPGLPDITALHSL